MESLQDRIETQIELMFSRPHRFGDPKDLELTFCIYLEIWEFLTADGEKQEWKRLWQKQCAKINPGRPQYTLADVYPFSIDRVREQIPAAVVEKSRRTVLKSVKTIRDELYSSIENGAPGDRMLINLIIERVDNYLKGHAIWPTDLETILTAYIDLLIELIQDKSAKPFHLRYNSPLGPSRHVFAHAKHSPKYPEVEKWAGYDQVAKGMKTVFSRLKQHVGYKAAVH